MNAVEIEAAVSELASAPFDAAEFPFQFLAAFDKKETTLKRLRKGDSNKSDVPGAVLLINSIHLATCPAGQTRETLERLKASPKTATARAKFVFATDGSYFEAEDVSGGAQEPIADILPNLANHFGFFLPLAGISTVREIKDNPIDVRATGRLNKLYVELLRINPEWGTAARRHDMNHFMARLIFCYFAEHTDIFNGYRLFTDTIEQMSEGDGSNTHQVMEQVFRAMDVKIDLRATSDVPPYANQFPYVNGGLFRGAAETPRFNRIARSYLLQAGKLEWQHINPDIFGSMIQAVADDEERGALGMHYTSVPNILKVLNPLFLDDLRAQLEAAGDNGRMLLNLRQRMSRIRVFDPACGSGNFLVIAYKQMRSIEAEINKRRDEVMRPTDISERNFRGIELRDFAAEIAGLLWSSLSTSATCTHATFRFAMEEFGAEAFDGRLVAIDEFHHVSTNDENRLGSQLKELLARGSAHVVAMTGSYFRGDAAAVLSPEDEARFQTVVYTYYEQLNGYQYLKSLNIGYWFYTGSYLDAIAEVLNPALKTIVHIPSVNSSASTTDKHEEVGAILSILGEWMGRDDTTDFHLVRQKDTGRILKVADLVDDSDGNRRSRILAALRNPAHRNDRDHVDIIIALGMAKEGFDWIWCEHALTVGYRNSLTEIVQIIGRVTRDAPGKTNARFTNLIAEPMAAQSDVVEAVNDTLKAIAASLLMEQVLAPKFDFTPKNAGPQPGFDYGADGYQEGRTNVGVDETNGRINVEIAGLKEVGPEAARICREDLNDVIAAFVQDKETLSKGLFDTENTLPQETTQLRMAKIVRDRYPELGEDDVEAVRQRAVAALTLVQQAQQQEDKVHANLGLLQGVRRFVLHVRELNVDLIDAINPFGEAYSVLARSMNEETLRQMQEKIAAKRVNMSEEEARQYAERAATFKRERNRLPSLASNDPWEKRLAEGVAAYTEYRKRAKAAAGRGEE